MPFDTNSALSAAFATNERINCYLIENVPLEAWDSPQPGKKGRTIAAIVAHIHNVRLMWLESMGQLGSLKKLDGKTCTAKEAIAALSESAKSVGDLLDSALAADGRVKNFKPDAASFFAYLVAHDAHHRGQITMLARQLGSPIPQAVMYGLWEWGKR
jgi:uncharacterized damage-inducible protein DinB